jgi:TIR domain
VILPVTEPTHAVFLSYASQDAEAAQKICEALRAAGIEVFLDQSELRGGDAWDQKIRHEIHDCALFIPMVSQHTQERLEGTHGAVDKACSSYIRLRGSSGRAAGIRPQAVFCSRFTVGVVWVLPCTICGAGAR